VTASERTARGGPAPADRPLRILVVARWYPAFDDPGRGSFVADQVAALRDAGHWVVVASWEHAARTAPAAPASAPASGGETPAAWLRAIARGVPLATPARWGAAGIPVARLPVVTLRGPGRAPRVADAVEAQAQTLNPFVRWLDARWQVDVIHAHTGVPDGLAAARVADGLGVPLVVTEHDSQVDRHLADGMLRSAYRDLVERSVVIAVSASLRARMVGALRIKPSAIHIVPNIVDVAAFTAIEGSSRDPSELLYVGARKASKGLDVLLRAFALVAADDPALHLRLIGRPPAPAEDERLHEMARELGVLDRVSFEPATDRPGVAAAMARAGMFVHPSPSETFGVVAAEALAAGLPVAATPSGGVDEILGDGGTFGVVARGHEPQDLADAIRGVRGRAGAFDRAALRAQAERYAAPVVAAQLEVRFRRAVASRRPRMAARSAASRPPLDVITPPPDEPPPLVVGLVRALAARRVGQLPPDLAARVVVVTRAERPGATVRTDLPGPARWIEVDPDARYQDALARLGGPLPPRRFVGRVARAIRHPVRAVQLRRLRRRRLSLRGPALRDGLLAARAVVAARRPGFDGPVPVVALDADDVTTIGATVRSETVLLGTTLRGLADAWTADRRGEPGSDVSEPAAGHVPDPFEHGPQAPPERRRQDGPSG
jgi:glycosyltransferase involved in cell wall biosynthesis